MSVSSIFSSNSSSYDLSRLNVSSTDSVSATSSDLASALSGTDSTSTDSTSSSTSTSVSEKAKLLKQLQQLQQTDPAKFKQVTADIASKLQEEAKQVGGSQGEALNKIADKFQQASQTGTLAALQHGGHGGHHGPPPASSADSSSASSSSTTDTSSTSANARAAAAYQKFSGQGVGADVDSIISQVLSADSTSTVSASS